MALMKKALGCTIIMVLSTPLAFAQQALSSWNDTALKQQIVTFVANTVDKSNEQYRPPEQRIAVFDNDGTL